MHHFIESLIKVVRQMDFRVIIEGVENEQQVAYLRKIGCDMVQGYYFSPPLGRFDFLKKLETKTFQPMSSIHRI
jgi:EAL domain-containing protein (putative c-di-GMP-specific phosphodiesterase class I)